MRRFKNILAVYDSRIGAEDTLLRAQALAVSNGARLTVGEIVSRPSNAILQMIVPQTEQTAKLDVDLLKERQARLDRIAGTLNSGDGPAQALLIQGNPATGVSEAVLRDGYDLVIATVDGPAGFGERAFRNQSALLMENCPCPVWLLKPSERLNRFARVLAFLDPSPETDAPSLLECKVLEMASSLAASERAKLDVFAMWEMVGDDYDSYRCEADKSTRRAVKDRLSGEKFRSVERVITSVEIPDIDFELHIKRGASASIIAEFANAREVDLIVIANPSKSGIEGWWRTNFTKHLLEYVDCSVLAVTADSAATVLSAIETRKVIAGV